MIVLSSALVLAEVQTYDPDSPVIGWHNLVTVDGLLADLEDGDFPAVNLANPNTSLEWRSTATDDQYITVITGYVDAIDYLAVARHNFGSTAQSVSVEGQSIEAGSWSVLVDELILADDSPVVFRFEPTILYAVRLRMRLGSDVPRAAVMYVGALLVMERRIYVGHTPLKYARRLDVVEGRAESEDYLGRIVTGEYRESSAAFSQLDPDWYRENMVPFVEAAGEQPFFFAWRPTTYPRESGYAVLMNDPMPTPDSTSHLIEVELAMRGIP